MPRGLTESYFRRGVADGAVVAIGTARLDVKPNKGVLAAWGAHWPFAQIDARRTLREWVQSAQARQAGVVRREIGTHDWWRELAKWRFLLAPAGTGVLTPKMVEALLVLTVPIALRVPALVDHVGLGFPLVLVEAWSEITAERLDGWWTELSPRLDQFRRRCLTAEGYWRLITGEVASCH
eukprot:gnl/TRDRNA2_/TRDRNA2_81831_c0_seq1.p1 gnl/TRDRNA2_/TRDRNA2_81831_c0~~gnl/TRDRNA2_/TRDRNA2_81831_c0_seq1.p1  ORF type:complete len:180 (+),score=18.87 gnl/TRDRNA2_/TRDRNA2_81831_c0_seq1:166-705(+)